MNFFNFFGACNLRTLGGLIIPSLLVIMLFLSGISAGCFGMVSNPPPLFTQDQAQDTEFSGYYYLGGAGPDIGGIIFYPDGKWEVVEGEEVVFYGRYLVRSGIIYMTEGDLKPQAVDNEASFEVLDDGETITDADGYYWYLDRTRSVSGAGSSSGETGSEVITTAPTPVSTVIMPAVEVTLADSSGIQAETDISGDEDVMVIILPDSGTDDLTFTLTSSEDVAAGKLKLNLEVDSTERITFSQGEKPDEPEPLQILRATFFAYNTGDVSSGFKPLTLGDVYASGMPYKTRSITVNEATADNIGAELPQDSASGWLDITEPYSYGVIVADAT
ncbi:hypothetical protein [Methanoplanus endosymbiosus]|uniref:Uncharacterized protein n=1 Tax=Methanoplanus endosymbiosus TaxID=33865 RepID=A0A9E7PMR3_9EURY|nr:hypothetical protein [Methanoplanus endosymbiosus]UUX92162.1 hypothetical protein L6E24_12500 [Methanoplanus endosymbiosus]